MSIEKLKKVLEKHEPEKDQVAAVAAGVVVAACAAVPPGRRDATTEAVLKGSAGERAERIVHPRVDDLFHVIARAEAKADAQPV